VPTTDAEVRGEYAGVLSQLQSILEVRGFIPRNTHGTIRPQYYLLVLREPLVSELFKSSYTKANQLSGGASSPTTRNPAVGPDQSRGSAFPMIQPMKAALYFDDVEGFGVVDPALNSSPERSTRLQACRRCNFPDCNEDQVGPDSSPLRLLLTPSRQLSQGHLSNDNQKPLTGPKTKLPVWGYDDGGHPTRSMRSVSHWQRETTTVVASLTEAQ